MEKRKETPRDGAKDKRIAASTTAAAADDDSLKKSPPPPPHNMNKISRKEKMRDKQKAIDISYQPRSLRKFLQRAKKNKFDPELLRVSADDFKNLPKEKQVHWITAHFLLRKYPFLFESDSSDYEDEDEDEDEDEEEAESEKK